MHQQRNAQGPFMKSQRLPVIRGRALEIVDDQGKVRASLSVLPEDPKVMWKGKPYPETVLLRLMSPEDRKSTRLNSSHLVISYAVFCLKKKMLTIFNEL